MWSVFSSFLYTFARGALFYGTYFAFVRTSLYCIVSLLEDDLVRFIASCLVFAFAQWASSHAQKRLRDRAVEAEKLRFKELQRAWEKERE